VRLGTDDGVEFAGFTPSFSIPPSFVLEYIPEPPIDVVAIPDPTAPDISIDVPTRPGISPALKLTAGDTTEIGGFATSASTTLTNAQRAQLDEYVNYLLQNPRANLRIEGHSDDRETPQVQARRANARATNVRNYLMSKGIPESRLFLRGRAALDSKAPNTTEEGQRRNRRVELIIF
jgi:outer membrane protein OmpA-like peptidoglycan-associated protein